MSHNFALYVVVLAAGRGSRLQGRPKPLRLLGGRPLVRHAVDLAIMAAIRPIVVTKPNDKRIRAALPQGVPIIENPNDAHGMGMSIACAATHLADKAKALILLPCDMPFVLPSTLAALARKADQSEEWVRAPYFASQRGLPVFFGRNHFRCLMALTKDRGASDCLERARKNNRLSRLNINDPGVLFDIDDRQTLARARRIWKRRQVTLPPAKLYA